jgi:hypothetical protein
VCTKPVSPTRFSRTAPLRVLKGCIRIRVHRRTRSLRVTRELVKTGA